MIQAIPMVKPTQTTTQATLPTKQTVPMKKNEHGVDRGVERGVDYNVGFSTWGFQRGDST